MKKRRCAVVGATGIVGQTFLRLLHDHPYFTVAAICASETRIGEKLGQSIPFLQESLPSEILNMSLSGMCIDGLKQEGISIVFSALPADIAKPFESAAAEAGLGVFSNASAHRMDKSVPILIPEVNSEHLALIKTQSWNGSSGGFIVTNANCTTTGLCVALAPISDLGIEELIVSSYQALSGAGYPGHAALEMSANCIPHIPKEEEKVRIETKKIFGTFARDGIKPSNWAVFPHCVRVSTPVGHLISVHAKIAKRADVKTIAERFRKFKPPNRISQLPSSPYQAVLLRDEPDRPQPRLDSAAGEPERARGMAVSVGRLSVSGKIIRFVALSHNLIRGAAGGSILNAELLYREGWL